MNKFNLNTFVNEKHEEHKKAEANIESNSKLDSVIISLFSLLAFSITASLLKNDFLKVPFEKEIRKMKKS
jgi:hypothetical protein